MILTVILDTEYYDVNEEGDCSHMTFSFLIEGYEGICTPLVYVFLRLMLALLSSLNRSRYGRAMATTS